MHRKRPHSKTRLGCQQCKSRRVKCDDGSPACSNCVRRGDRCSLTEVKLYLLHQLPPLQRSLDQRQMSTYAVLDLDLTRFYAVATCRTIMFRPTLHEFWRDAVFDLSLGFPALLDSLLTTAAMHKIATSSNTRDCSQYIEYATKKKNQLIPFLIAMLKAPSLENCPALLVSSIILALWGFAARSLPSGLDIVAMPSLDADDMLFGRNEEQPGVLREFVKILSISHGIFAVAAGLHPWLEKRGFGELLRSPDSNMLPALSNDIELALNDVEDHLKADHEIHDGDCDNATFTILCEQIAEVRKLFRVCQCPEWYDMMVGWAIRLPKAMIMLMIGHHPGALTIVAYWTSCLSVLEDRWWIQGWTEALFAEVSRLLGEEWSRHLDLPRKVFNGTVSLRIQQDGVIRGSSA